MVGYLDRALQIALLVSGVVAIQQTMPALAGQSLQLSSFGINFNGALTTQEARSSSRPTGLRAADAALAGGLSVTSG